MNIKYYLDSPYKEGYNAKLYKAIRAQNKSGKECLKDNEVTIYMIINFRFGKLGKINTGHSIKPIFWNFKAQEAKTGLPGYELFNSVLLNNKNLINNRVASLFIENPDCSYEAIMDIARTVFWGNLNRSDKQITYAKAFQEFLEEKKPSIESGTYKRYLTLEKAIIEFHNSKSSSELLLKDMDAKFYSGLYNFYLAKKHQPQTIKKNMDSLRVFGLWGKHNRNYPIDFNFKIPKSMRLFHT